MKKYIPILIIILALSLIFVGCNQGKDGIVVKCSVSDVMSMTSAQLENCDFTKFFVITENGQSVSVIEDYLDLSDLPNSVSLTYKGHTAKVTLTIIEPEVSVSALEQSITLDTKQIKTFDFTSLFSITVDGENVPVTDEYLDKSQVPYLVGTGSVTLNYLGKSATVIVNLIQAEKEISIVAKQTEVTVIDEEFETYRFTDLFGITVDDKYVTVMKSYLTVSDIVDGKATVTCSYQGKSATVDVIVQKTIYVLTLQTNVVEVNGLIAETYDYLSLFDATRNGEKILLTADNVSTNVSREIGEYYYTVTVGKLESNKVSATLTVKVVTSHSILIVNNYHSVEMTLSELPSYDYTQLFTLYVDGVFVPVTLDMIDLSEIQNAESGKEYTITCTYIVDESSNVSRTKIRVVDDASVEVTAKSVNVDVYSTPIDLTTLFSAKIKDRDIAITDDMISGEVDYQTAGTYVITCTIGNKSVEAVVTVSDGVVIGYKNGDRIVIRKGTDKKSYSFASDFVVKINGLTFTDIDACIDASAVDFDQVGEYTATLTVLYNTKKPSLSSVPFDTYTASITYVVVDKAYNLIVPDETVVLPLGTDSFDVLSKITLTINGRNQKLTSDSSAISAIACYYRNIGADIDFGAVGIQTVEIALYVFGLDQEPVIARYNVIIESDINITSSDKVVFVGDTLYTTDLFTVIENGNPVQVTYDMIEGKVDTLTAGEYYVTVTYKGIVSQTKVIVYSHSIKGRYFTPLKTMSVDTEYDDEGYVTVDGSTSMAIGDLVITDTSLSFDGVVAQNVRFESLSSIVLTFGSTEYTLHLEDGYAVLEPENRLKMQFTNSKRPLIFFDASRFQVQNRIQINSLSEYILRVKNTGFSIDSFKLLDKQTDNTVDIGLYVRITSASASMTGDITYQVKWGNIVFADDFEQATGVNSSFVFDEGDYSFTMITDEIAKIATAGSDNMLLADKTINGTYENGKTARITISSSGGMTIYVDGVQVASFTAMDISNSMKYGGYNATTGILTLFNYNDTYAGKQLFSARFIVDVENGTVEYVEKNSVWGYYVYDKMAIFLDGYGNGLINYDTKSYYSYKISYQISSGYLKIRYQSDEAQRKYGDEAQFALESFDNVLRAKYFYDQTVIDRLFENKIITSGAIIRVEKLTVGRQSSLQTVKSEIESQITIITKDGVVADENKKDFIDYTTFKQSKAGFYRLGIKIEVDGVIETSYYVVQVMDDIYNENKLVGDYKTSVINDGYSLTLDKWGRIVFTTKNQTYRSSYRIFDDNFYAKFSGNGYSFDLKGTYVGEGLVSILTSGTMIVNDMFTVGVSSVSATDGASLRKITIDDDVYFYYSTSYVLIGSKVEVSALSGNISDEGSILQITLANGSVAIVKIKSWSDATDGLILSDEYRGTYTQDETTLILNGFGEAVLSGLKGVYDINSNKTLTVTIGTHVYFYQINFGDKTFATADMVVNNTIMEGRELKAKYTFGSGSGMYSAETTFKFTVDGKVIISSTSSEYTDDKGAYMPVFVTDNGSYTVNRNVLTVVVGSETFVFKILDVSSPDDIELTSTTLNSTSIGYFKVGQVFGKYID